MPALFNLTYRPSKRLPNLPTNVYPYLGEAIYRGDPYAIQFTLLDGTDPWVPEGELFAQLRRSNCSDVVDSFSVDVADNVVTISLTPDQTGVLPSEMVWDFEQRVDGVVVATWFAGEAEAWGDVTRAAA